MPPLRGGDPGRARDRLRDRRDDADAGVGVRAARLRAPAAPGRLFIEFALTLAGAVLVSGFVALTLSPMMCSLLLRHKERHSWIYNAIERGLNAMTQGYRRAAHRRAAPALGGRRAVGRRRRAGRAVLHAAQGRAHADRGPRRRVRPGDRAAGLDAAVYTSEQIAADRGVLFADSRGVRVYGDIAGFPTVVDGNAVLRLKPWEERTKQAAADRRRAAAEVRGDSRRDRLPDQPAVAGPVVPLDAGRVRDHVAGSLSRTAAHRRPFPRGGAQVSRRAEPADRPEAEYPGGPRHHQPRQALRHRRRRRHGGTHAGDHARRPPGDALQEGWRAVRRDRAGRAARPLDAGGHPRHLRPGPRRRHGAAVESRRSARRRRAAVAQPLQPPARRQGHRDARAGLCDRRGAGGDERRGEAFAAPAARRPTSTASRANSARPAARSISRSCWR